jgi:hypothetical protein
VDLKRCLRCRRVDNFIALVFKGYVRSDIEEIYSRISALNRMTASVSEPKVKLSLSACRHFAFIGNKSGEPVANLGRFLRAA